MRSLVWLALVILAGCGDPVPTSVDGAIQAYGRNRVGEAEAVFRKIAGDPGAAPGDKARSHRELARIAWLVDGDSDRALGEIGAALATRTEICASARLEARVLQEAAKPDRLLARLDSLLAACGEPDQAGQADRIRLHAALAALDRASAGRPEGVGDSARLLAAMGEDSRESLGGSAVALEAALLGGDPAGALKAWKDYFWLSDRDVPQGLAGAYPAAAPLFEAALGEGAQPSARLRLVDLLVRAGFARPAERFARATGLARTARGDPLWRKAAAYFEARRTLEAAVLESNRRVAPGQLGRGPRGFARLRPRPADGGRPPVRGQEGGAASRLFPLLQDGRYRRL